MFEILKARSRREVSTGSYVSLQEPFERKECPQPKRREGSWRVRCKRSGVIAMIATLGLRGRLLGRPDIPRDSGELIVVGGSC